MSPYDFGISFTSYAILVDSVRDLVLCGRAVTSYYAVSALLLTKGRNLANVGGKDFENDAAVNDQQSTGEKA
jgi:hypothetical protein